MARLEVIGDCDNLADAEHFCRFVMQEVGVESGVAQYSRGNSIWVVGLAPQIQECRRLLRECLGEVDRMAATDTVHGDDTAS